MTRREMEQKLELLEQKVKELEARPPQLIPYPVMTPYPVPQPALPTLPWQPFLPRPYLPPYYPTPQWQVHNSSTFMPQGGITFTSGLSNNTIQ